MARVELRGLPLGVVQDRHGNAERNRTFSLSGGTLYAEATGSTAQTPLKSNADGELPGWLDSGVYTLMIGSKSITFEVGGGARTAEIERVVTYLPAASGNATTDVANLVAANATCVAAGGGTILAGPTAAATPYLLNAEVTLSALVNLEGAGKEATVFRLAAAGARITFADGFGGKSGNFSVYGGASTSARVATQGIIVGVANQRSFEDINVQWTTTDAWQINGTQNSTFSACTAYHNTGDGFQLDKGCGGNLFLNLGGSNNRGYAVAFRQTEATPSLYPVPSYNTFVGGVFERPIDLTVHAAGLVYHGAGTSNEFKGSAFAGSGITDAMSLVVVDLAVGAAGSAVVVDGCVWAGIASTTMIDILATGQSAVVLNGRSTFLSALNAIRFADTDVGSYVEVNGQPILSSVTNWMVKTTGVGALLNLVKRRTSEVTHEMTVAAATTPAVQVKLAGEAYPRVEIRPDIGVALGTGLLAPDANFYRIGPNVIGSTTHKVHGAALAVSNTAAAGTPGTVTKKMEVFDVNGVSLGFVAIYDAIT